MAALRSILASFTVAVLTIGVVAVLVAPEGDGSVDVVPASVAVAAAGAVLLGLASRVRPTLSCESREALAASYRTRFFVRIALSESAALLGFAAVFLAASPVPYFVGLPFTLAGFALVAPTQRNLDADEEALRASGCPYSLAEALDVTPPAGGPPRG